MAPDRDIAAFDVGCGTGYLALAHQDRQPSRKARTTRRATRLLAAVGFQTIQWHRIDAVIICAATAQVATGRK